MSTLFPKSKAEYATQIECAYTAGFVDGEGTITANFRLTARGLYEAVHYRTSIPNTNRDVLIWVRSVFGGSLEPGAKPRSPKHKKVQTLYWGGPDCIPVLKALLPYLRVKRRQAELVLALHDLALPRGKARRQGIPRELAAQRNVIVGEIAALNYRGVPPQQIEGEQ